MMEKENLMRSKLIDLFFSKAFVHIIFNSTFHYNGWILAFDQEHIQFRDRKTDEVLVLKIGDISLAEEVRE